MNKLKALTLVVVLIIIDQFTKLLAIEHLKDKEPIIIIEGVFKLLYIENSGVAFGLFQNKAIFFAIMNLVILIGIIWFYTTLPKEKKYMPIRLILLFISAGAVGNFIDRIKYNYVVDFFYFELINFPIFNVADCYVTVSSFVLIILFIFYYKDDDFKFKKVEISKDNSANEDLDGRV